MKKTKLFKTVVGRQHIGYKDTDVDEQINEFVKENNIQDFEVQLSTGLDSSGNTYERALLVYKENQETNILPTFIQYASVELLETTLKTLGEEIGDIKVLEKNGEKGKSHLWDKYGENLLFSHEELKLLMERQLEKIKEQDREG
ncbi:hypothetical protein P9X10_02525 [Bacillus cereus]|nr:hypothetical protein [Bacillus cereus]